MVHRPWHLIPGCGHSDQGFSSSDLTETWKFSDAPNFHVLYLEPGCWEDFNSKAGELTNQTPWASLSCCFIMFHHVSPTWNGTTILIQGLAHLGSGRVVPSTSHRARLESRRYNGDRGGGQTPSLSWWQVPSLSTKFKLVTLNVIPLACEKSRWSSYFSVRKHQNSRFSGCLLRGARGVPLVWDCQVKWSFVVVKGPNFEWTWFLMISYDFLWFLALCWTL